MKSVMATRCPSGVAYLYQRRNKYLFRYICEAMKGIQLNTSDMGKSRVLQNHIWSVKVRRIAHPKLSHGKNYKVLLGVTGLE